MDNIHLQQLFAFDNDLKMYYFDHDQQRSFDRYPNRLITFEDIFGEAAPKKVLKAPNVSIEDLQNLNSAFKYWLKKKNYRFVNQMILQFDESSSEDELKTVLMITKPIQDHELLRKNRQRVKRILDEKIKKNK